MGGETQPVIATIGDLVEDVVVWPGGPVAAGTDNPSIVRRSRGGSAANVAVAAAAAGAGARFIGSIGADATGDRLVDELSAAGVDTRVQRRGRTGCVVVLVEERGERTMFPDRGAAAELGPIPPEDLADVTVLHVPLYGFLDAGSATHLATAVRYAASRGARLSLDLSATAALEQLGADRVRRLVTELRPALVFANEAEAEAAGLAAIRPHDGGAFVVKAGALPARLVRADGSVELVAPARVETVRDTTGAGDRFAGAFLARWAAGAPLAAACAAAHRAAARTLGAPGATVEEPAQRR